MNNIIAELEKTGVELKKEQWKLEIGLSHSKPKIKNLEAKSAKLYEQILKLNLPKLFRTFAIDEVAHSKTAPLYLELHTLRDNCIKSKHQYNDRQLTWSSWRQFNSIAPDNERKEVFDEFIVKSKGIEPVVAQRFEKAGKVYKEYEDTLLDNYLRQQGITLNSLKSMLNGLRKVKSQFTQNLLHYSQEIFGREPEYYDDLYVMRNKIYDSLSVKLTSQKALAAVKKVMKSLKLEGPIAIDLRDRPRKAPSAFCTFIQVPGDIRISVKPENSGVQDAIAVFHEYGHAVHASNIVKTLPYWMRNCLSTSLCETFSQLFENLLTNVSYLRQKLHLDKKIAEEVAERTKFIEQYVTAFYTANSLFKIDCWSKSLSMSQAHKNYAFWYKKCVGIEMPGRYWLLHHILPEDFMYVPSYLISRIKVSELDAYLQEKYGNWWNNPKAGVYLKKFMEPGVASKLRFGNPKPKLLLKELQ